jgi:putative transcriptional regulator
MLTFIEHPAFTRFVTDWMSDAEYREFQRWLAANPTGVWNMKRNDVEFDADGLIGALTDIRDHVRGARKLTLRTAKVALPAPEATIKPREIAAIRRDLNVSQTVFARLLNVPEITAASWERGRRHPSGAAVRLLQIARQHPEVLLQSAR